MGNGVGYQLCHLVTGNLLFAIKFVGGNAVDETGFLQLQDSFVGPVVSWHIGKHAIPGSCIC